MPNYFDEYDTTVHFITAEEMAANHAGLPHGGFVIRTGSTGWEDEHKHVVEYSLKLDSNPEFTSSVIAAYARAAYRMSGEGQTGCKTVFDVAPAYLSLETRKNSAHICCKNVEKKESVNVNTNIDPKREAKRIIFGLIGAVIMAVNIKTFVRAGDCIREDLTE